MIKYCKDVLVFSTTGKIELYNEEEISGIKNISEAVDKNKLVDLIYKLSELENEIKWSTQKTIMFQAGIIRLCNKQEASSNDLQERVDKIEKYLKSGKGIAINQQGVSNSQVAVNNNMGTATNQASPRVTNNNNANLSNNSSVRTSKSQQVTPSRKYSNKAEEYWPQIVSDLKQSGKIVLYTNLMGTTVKELNDMTVGIEFPNGMSSFGKAVLEKQENIREISNLVSIANGKEMQIKYITKDAAEMHQLTNEENLQNFANESNIPFNIIE